MKVIAFFITFPVIMELSIMITNIAIDFIVWLKSGFCNHNYRISHAAPGRVVSCNHDYTFCNQDYELCHQALYPPQGGN